MMTGARSALSPPPSPPRARGELIYDRLYTQLAGWGKKGLQILERERGRDHATNPRSLGNLTQTKFACLTRSEIRLRTPSMH